MKGLNFREYTVTAHSKGYQFARGFSAVVLASSIRQAWRSFKQTYPHHSWIFDSIKSDTGYYTKIN